MARALTVDASVFVSALSPSEARNQESLRFLETLRDHPRLVVIPTLVKPEIAGALNRATDDSDLALEAAELTFLAGPVLFVDLDRALADEAAGLAVRAGFAVGMPSTRRRPAASTPSW